MGLGKSLNAIQAEKEKRFPKTKFMKILKKLEPDFFRGLGFLNFELYFSSNEWHHTGPNFRKTKYYDLRHLAATRYYVFFELTKANELLGKKRNFREVFRDEFSLKTLKSLLKNFSKIRKVQVFIEDEYESIFVLGFRRNLMKILKKSYVFDSSEKMILRETHIFLPDHRRKKLFVIHLEENSITLFEIDKLPNPKLPSEKTFKTLELSFENN